LWGQLTLQVIPHELNTEEERMEGMSKKGAMPHKLIKPESYCMFNKDQPFTILIQLLGTSTCDWSARHILKEDKMGQANQNHISLSCTY